MPQGRAGHVHELSPVRLAPVVLSPSHLASVGMQVAADAEVLADLSPVQAGEERARRTIRSEMARREVTYPQLAERLAAIGVDENKRNLRNKVSRGEFTAGFMLQCLTALWAQQLRLD